MIFILISHFIVCSFLLIQFSCSEVRDSVVNQLLAKIDGVKEVPNVLIVGLTNRPELLDQALLRPGRLEVQLRVELPDR